MKKLPVGIQTFSRLITENYLYVDKTALIYQLITSGSYYFIARPRRFGKSLLVSTLAALFSGKKELFNGLAISSLPYSWETHPVILISFSDIPYSTPELLEQGIKNYLHIIAQQYSIQLPAFAPGEMLRYLVMNMSQRNKVVLLIDEYDYPILQHVHNIAVAEKMREVLKNFYGVIKGLDPYLTFVLLTGVSQFSKTSIFSGLNNLEDISLSKEYNSLFGYTRHEIETCFNEYLTHNAHEMNCSIEHLLDEITIWYDGYTFTKATDAIKMYNPFSVLLCLKRNEFSNYWFETGTPTFLINLLKSHNYPMQEFESIPATTKELKQFDIENINLKTLLFQTGYLTIKNYDKETDNYILQSPNKENTQSLLSHIFASMTNISDTYLNDYTAALRKIFYTNDCSKLYETLTHIFSEIPYTIQIPEEKYYQTIFYVILKMLGAYIVVEQPTNIGRIDAVVQTKSIIFIIEFKINSTASKALKQIERKKYYQQHLSSGKEIILVGITFDTKNRNVSDVVYKKL